MQEFYKINQGPKETMMDFRNRLYSTLTKIRTNHPNLMSELELEKRLQDHFFYRLKLPLRDSIHYHYEQMEADYDILVDEAKKREDECNFNNSNNNPVVAKSGPVDQRESELQALKQQVVELLTIVKSQNVVNNSKNRKGSYNNNEKVERPQETLLRTFGPGLQTNASGPFRWNQRPIMCYRHRRWGHMARECSTPAGFQVPQGLNFNGGRTIPLSPLERNLNSPEDQLLRL